MHKSWVFSILSPQKPVKYFLKYILLRGRVVTKIVNFVNSVKKAFKKQDLPMASENQM